MDFVPDFSCVRSVYIRLSALLSIMAPGILLLTLHSEPRWLLAAQFEKLERQLRRESMFDRVTGLLLLFPSCLLHVVEVSSLSCSQAPCRRRSASAAVCFVSRSRPETSCCLS